jgi:competence protein ComGC
MTANQRQFSLIEMLLVVSVIMILASMLLPVLVRAKESGKRAVCASNMKQLGQGCALWGHNNNRDTPTPNPIAVGGASYVVYYKSSDKYLQLGLLAGDGILQEHDITNLYCPTWNHPYIKYDTVSPDGKQGGFPAPGNVGPSRYYHTSYEYHTIREDDGTKRAANYSKDNPDTPLIADHWSQKASDAAMGFTTYGGGWWGHQEVYMTSYMDGHAQIVWDRGYAILYAAVSHGKWGKLQNGWDDWFLDY